jgi:hypothetical protein
MPIFHDPHDSPPQGPSPRQTSHSAQREAESPNLAPDTSLLDGVRSWDSTGRGALLNMNSELCGSGQKQTNFDRMELIERLKRTKSPPWQQDEDVSHPRPLRQYTSLCTTMYLLTLRRRTSTPITAAPNRNRTVESDRRAPRYPSLNSKSSAHLPQTLFETLPQQAWRSSDLGLLCTRETSERGKMTEVKKVARLQLLTWRLHPWCPGAAHSQQQPIPPNKARRTLSIPYLVKNPAQSQEQERHHNHRQARSRFYPRQALWYSRPITLIWTSPRNQVPGKVRKVQMATTGATLSHQPLSRRTRLPQWLGQYPALQLHGIFAMEVPYHTRHINRDAL